MHRRSLIFSLLSGVLALCATCASRLMPWHSRSRLGVMLLWHRDVKPENVVELRSQRETEAFFGVAFAGRS